MCLFSTGLVPSEGVNPSGLGRAGLCSTHVESWEHKSLGSPAGKSLESRGPGVHVGLVAQLPRDSQFPLSGGVTAMVPFPLGVGRA